MSDSEPTGPLSVDGNSSELEMEEEDEEEGGRGGGAEVGASQLVPQTPDQEAFLKEHFVTLADLSGSGTAGAHGLYRFTTEYTNNTDRQVALHPKSSKTFAQQ